MWLVWLKIMFDSSSTVRAFVGLFIVYLIGYILYAWFGWVGIVIPLLIIFIAVIYACIPSREEKEAKMRTNEINNSELTAYNSKLEGKEKKAEETKPKAKKVINTEVESKPLFKKKYSNDEAKWELARTLEKHRGAISDISYQDGEPLYRVYWLESVKDVKKEETGSELFDVNFAIDKDCKGIVVSITNKSEDIIDMEWKYLEINRKRVYIDGVYWVDYEGSGVVEVGETVSKMVQPWVYKGGKLQKMFDLDIIKKEVQEHEVSFHAKCGRKAKRKYSYTLYTKIKIVF